jgi:hypothetical protein
MQISFNRLVALRSTSAVFSVEVIKSESGTVDIVVVGGDDLAG